jgi:hypothetical protein
VWDRALETKLKNKREEVKGIDRANLTMNNNNMMGGGHRTVDNALVPTGNYQYFKGNRTPAPTLDTSKHYVLVVEDNCMITMVLEMSLKMMGFTAVLAENGKIGVEKFTQHMQ